MDDHKRLLNDDGEDLDKEVESCLTGAGPGTRFYLGQEAASSPTSSFHSTATEYHSDGADQESRVNEPYEPYVMYFAKDFEGFLIHINCAFDSCNHVPDKRLTMKLYAMVH